MVDDKFIKGWENRPQRIKDLEKEIQKTAEDIQRQWKEFREACDKQDHEESKEDPFGV